MIGPENFPALVSELEFRGYSDADMRKIMYDNFVRLTSVAMRPA
jgi:microsomal dipeptidase-like Zn-dependent dipeptidase